MGAINNARPVVVVGDFLRPPWPVILLYAVQGWAERRAVPLNGQRLPARQLWLPVFIRLLHHPDACQTIADYAVQGLRADGLPDDLSATVQRAMRRADALAGMVDALTYAASR